MTKSAAGNQRTLLASECQVDAEQGQETLPAASRIICVLVVASPEWAVNCTFSVFSYRAKVKFNDGVLERIVPGELNKTYFA